MGSNRRYGHRNIKPEWSASIGGMLEYGTKTQSTCRQCGDIAAVPLEFLLARFGQDYDLAKHDAKCLLCGGSLLIQARQGDHSPWRPLSE